MVNGIWTKKNKLGELKTELAAVDRKIQLSIEEPVKQGEEAEQEHTSKRSEETEQKQNVSYTRKMK